MNAKTVSQKALLVFAVIAVAFTASLLWPSTQAHAASKTVARIVDSHDFTKGSYDSLQAALDAVEDNQKVYLMKDVDINRTLHINRGKNFTLDLHGHAITSDFTSTRSYILNIDNGNGRVVINDTGSVKTAQPGIRGIYNARCFYLKSGQVIIWAGDQTIFKGGRVADVYGGELRISGGTYENSIVVYNPEARLIINDGKFEKKVNISAKGENACYMEINGGEFLANIANTGKTAFIKGGKFHYLRMPKDEYIHPEYYKVEDSITREGRTETAYRIVKKPPSVAFTPDSGSIEYDPTGSGTQVTAKVVDSDGTTELKPATFKWYKGDELIAEAQTVTLNEPGTYKVVGTYKSKNYEAEYVVKPADISSGCTSSISEGATFTGFSYGKDFVKDNVKLCKSGSTEAIEGFTFDVEPTGENINAGANAGTYTIEGNGKFTGKLSGTFNISQADFSRVAFTVNPAETAYTGTEIEPTVIGTLTTDDNKVYTLDPSEYTVEYSDNTLVGTATATVTSKNKNFTTGTTSKNFTIKKAANDVSVSLEGWAWGETAKTPSVEASFGADGATLTYKKKGAADNTYDTADVILSKPGQYTVRATIEGTDNYEGGVATADFTIGPMPIAIASAEVTGRTYEKGNTTVAVSSVTFKDSNENPVDLTPGTSYTASGKMETADAGDEKPVTVTVQLKDSNYSLEQNTFTTTADIAKATLPAQNVRVAGPITIEDYTSVQMTTIEQSVKDVVPSDAGTSVTYLKDEEHITKPEDVDVSGFNVSNDGLVTATLKGVEEGQNVTLPVIVSSQNYEDSTINVVVEPKNKTLRNVTLSEYDTSKTYGDGTFELTATAKDIKTGEVVDTEEGDWYWYSSDPNVLEVAKTRPNTATVTVKGAGSARILAWYETFSGETLYIGAALTDSITVNKQPVTITVTSPESIYVDGTVPTLNDQDGHGLNSRYTVEGLLGDDQLTTLPTLAYFPEADNKKPGTYAIVPSGADAGSNYAISYVNGALTVEPKKTQAITVADVTATYGDEDAAVSATVTEPAEEGGEIAYAVKSGRECIDIDESGNLTIKKAGEATVTVTAAETNTHAQATQDVTVTINRAESKPANVTDPEYGWTYDGSERRLVVVEGEVTGGVMKYSLDGKSFSSSVPTATKAGDYTVWYKVAGDENHNDSKIESIEVTVYKAIPVVDPPGPLTATCGDLLESVKLPKDENGVWTWGADPGAIVEHAGENNFEVIYTPNDTDNYDDINALATVTAAKGASSVSKAPAAKTLTYNGKAQALVAAGRAEGGAMEYSLDGEEFYEEIPTGYAAGDYKVWYMVAGDEDHNDSKSAYVNVKMAKAAISKATVAKIADMTYTGKALKPTLTVKFNGKTLKKGTDYTLSYKNNKKIGRATVTVTGKGNFTGTKTVKFAIKAANKLTVKVATKTVKASAKAQRVSPITKVSTKVKAKVTYSKAATAKAKKLSGYKVLTVNKKNGKITVKAGTKAGTYKLMVKMTAAKTAKTTAATKTVTVTVKVADKAAKSSKAQTVQRQANGALVATTL